MINVSKTSLPGVLKIKRFMSEDHRGIYAEIYQKQKYFEAGITVDFVEQNFSCSRKNVLRGMHGDSNTWKLISCLYGKLYLAVLNYDADSLAYGRWEIFVLTLENSLQILIPPRYANGHLVLSEEAVFHYNQSEYYTDGKNQFTVMWDDPRFNIPWPITNPILSKRDGG